jgi:hypothetical protein
MTGTLLLPERSQGSPSISRADHLANFVSEDLVQASMAEACEMNIDKALDKAQWDFC